MHATRRARCIPNIIRYDLPVPTCTLRLNSINHWRLGLVSYWQNVAGLLRVATNNYYYYTIIRDRTSKIRAANTAITRTHLLWWPHSCDGVRHGRLTGILQVTMISTRPPSVPHTSTGT